MNPWSDASFGLAYIGLFWRSLMKSGLLDWYALSAMLPLNGTFDFPHQDAWTPERAFRWSISSFSL